MGGCDGSKRVTFLRVTSFRIHTCSIYQPLRDPSFAFQHRRLLWRDELFKNITFTVAGGERWGIIGRNGAGKTSIFRLITGELEPTVGSVCA
jgi:ABC-type polysaccharide/polyol phosphate transport system ATPase subunit